MNNLYAFHGGDRKVGVTMVAQSVAQYIAANRPEIDVLLLTLNGRENSQYVHENAVPIDQFKNQIDSGIVIHKEDLEKCKIRDNLYVISGIEQEMDERFYLPETAIAIMEDLSPQFKLMIADTGSELDNGLAIGGLLSAKVKYLILSQNEATIKRYEKTRLLYESMNIKFKKIIVNKYSTRDPYSIDYIRKRINEEKGKMMSICLAGYGRQAEMEYKTLLEFREDEYTKNIAAIAQHIGELEGLGEIAGQRKNKWKNFI